MKALERKTYACETQEGRAARRSTAADTPVTRPLSAQEGRRRWADCARLEARTPARLSLESAIGQAGHWPRSRSELRPAEPHWPSPARPLAVEGL